MDLQLSFISLKILHLEVSAPTCPFFTLETPESGPCLPQWPTSTMTIQPKSTGLQTWKLFLDPTVLSNNSVLKSFIQIV